MFSPLIYWCLSGELKQTKKPNLSEREKQNIINLLNRDCQT